MIRWTEFPDYRALHKTEHDHTWPQLLRYVQAAGPFPEKDAAPLLVLGTFDTKRTDKYSLRHEANMLLLTGIVGDYDGEKVSMAEAVAMLESAGIRAAVYPTGRHTEEKPRWRVLCPLATPTKTDQQDRLLGRLNGALGGILADESWSVSQSFYFGGIEGKPWRVVATFDDPEEGTCIDELHELDEIAFGKPSGGGKPPDGQSKPVELGIFTDQVQALGRKLREGDGRRALMKTFAASRSSRGLPYNDLRLILRGAAAEFFDLSDPVDWGNIDTLALSFARKDGNRISVDFSGLIPDEETGELVPAMKSVSIADLIENPPQPPQFVWEGLVPRKVVTLFGAHGGKGKSWIGLMLAVATAMGRPLFGVPTVRSKALFLSLEDDESIVRWRLSRICHEWMIAPADLLEWLHIADATENPELFECDGRKAGNQTATYAALSRGAADFGAGLIVVDNASDAFGGDEIQRRQVRAFMRSLAKIAKRDDAGVVLLAHVDKGTSRSNKPDGGEGYSGSTAWHNSARSRLFMSEKSGTLVLEQQKSNYAAKKQAEILLWWPEGKIPQLIDQSAPDAQALIDKAVGLADDKAAEKLLHLLAEYEQRGQYCSSKPNSPTNPYKLLQPDPAFKRLGLRREDVARIVNQCQRAGWIEMLDYQTKDRKWRERWTVTASGYDWAGLVAPSAPSAPSPADSADSAEGGEPVAPSAPTGVGVIGGRERARHGAKHGAKARKAKQ